VLTVARVQGSAAYTDRDRDLLTALLSRAALVVEATHTASVDRAVSETMQRALLPQLLPQPDHLQMASRYLPAENSQLVGGDWWDAYLDVTGTTSLVIGDVAGHDITAAATMGQLRTMLRMAGHDGTAGPATVLNAVDVACATFGQTVFATALVARIERFDPVQPARERLLTWSSAGHPPPLVLHPDGCVRVLTDPVGLPIGVDADRERPEHAVVVPAGATLLLYTDGLLEQRSTGPEASGAPALGVDRDLDAGLDRLTALLSASTGLDLEALCDRIIADLLPAAGAADDVALIAIRPFREDQPRPAEAGPNVMP
jgi:serine phosphatase RsbU (regulator of sigma subunit)